MRTRGLLQQEFSPSKEALAGQGSSQPERMSGFLKKKNRKHGILGSKWNKRWFVLENGILTYAKNKQEIVKGEIQVFSMHELEYVCQRKERLEFELKFPERVLHLQALCKDDLTKWIGAFENSKRTGMIRAQQHSPTSPLDLGDCGDLPRYRTRTQTSRDCKSAGATGSSQKKNISPRSLLANPDKGRRCFGNYFDDLEADISSGYVHDRAERKTLDRNQDTCVEEFSLDLSESPVQPTLSSLSVIDQAVEDDENNHEIDLGYKAFTTLSLEEKSDEGWLDEDWDTDESEEKQGMSAGGSNGTTTPVVFISSPKSNGTSKSGTISSMDGLLQCDLKAVKYDSQITLPELEPIGDAMNTIDICDGQAPNVLDNINPDDDWLNDDWDSE